MRNNYENDLLKLNSNIICMAELIKNSLEEVFNVLFNFDKTNIKKIISDDDLIDAKEKEIEQLCLQLLLQQQPLASDLRTITSALKMVTDLERIGDHASDISDFCLQIENSLSTKIPELKTMSVEIKKMVTNSIESFVSRNLSMAKDCIVNDDIVDALYHKIKKLIVTLIQENKTDGEQIADYLLIAKYFERIADHATNIAQWTIFAITGELEN